MAIAAERGYSVVGKSVPRYDGLLHVTGETRFVDDIYLPGMLYIKTRNSEHFNARILAIDASEAEKMPGVVKVLTARDVPNNRFGITPDQPVLADGYVRHLGQPIAAVAAETEEMAEEAAKRVKVTFEVLPTVEDAWEAMRPDSTPAHLGTGSSEIPNIAQNGKYNHRRIRHGDAEKGLKESDLIIEDRFCSQMREHVPLETHCAVAQMDSMGKLTIWTTSQAVHMHQRVIAGILKLPYHKLRLIGGTVGGGFGSKNEVLCDHLAGLVAMKVGGRPVKWLWTREEEFLNSSVNSPYPLFWYKTGVKRDGAMVAQQVLAIQDGGAYTIYSLVGINKLGIMGRGPYRIPNYWYDGYVVFTNHPASGAMRGFNLAEACFGWEQHVDHVAEVLGMSPYDLRMKNLQVPGDATTTGDPMEGITVRECLEEVAKACDYQKRWRGWSVDRKGPAKKRGIGLCAQHQVMGLPYGGDPSQAEVQIMGDGTVHLRHGTVDMGQGGKTVMAIICAEELGVPYESITVTNADTETTPLDGGSYANRCTFFMGNATRSAAREVKGMLLEEASEQLGAPPADLDVRDGRVYVKDSPEQAIPVADIANVAIWKKGKFLLGRGSFYPNAGYPGDDDTSQGKPYDSYMFAAGAAEIEVDTETGEITVLKMHMAYDCGRALNRTSIEGQMYGGASFGLGQVLMEDMLPYYPKAEPITTNLHDYLIMTAPDMERTQVNCILVEIPHPRGPFGAKGMGEFTSNVQAAAIANAFYDATGVRMYGLPMTPERVLRALRGLDGKPPEGFHPRERGYDRVDPSFVKK